MGTGAVGCRCGKCSRESSSCVVARPSGRNSPLTQVLSSEVEYKVGPSASVGDPRVTQEAAQQAAIAGEGYRKETPESEFTATSVLRIVPHSATCTLPRILEATWGVIAKHDRPDSRWWIDSLRGGTYGIEPRPTISICCCLRAASRSGYSPVWGVDLRRPSAIR